MTIIVRHYAVQLVKKGIRVPVCIEYGPPRDPLTHEVLDRSWTWRAFFEGEPIPIEDVIVEFDPASGEPVVKGEPITEEEYNFLIESHAWDRENDPAAPGANPRKAINLNQLPPLF